VPPQATFLFKHALVQDTAYSMLLRRHRRSLHARIACALEEQFPTLSEARPEILAHHFTEAGLFVKAVAHWCRAGHQSLAKSGFVEAVNQLRTGLRRTSLIAAEMTGCICCGVEVNPAYVDVSVRRCRSSPEDCFQSG
jgi:predicted ATPase